MLPRGILLLLAAWALTKQRWALHAGQPGLPARAAAQPRCSADSTITARP